MRYIIVYRDIGDSCDGLCRSAGVANSLEDAQRIMDSDITTYRASQEASEGEDIDWAVDEETDRTARLESGWGWGCEWEIIPFEEEEVIKPEVVSVYATGEVSGLTWTDSAGIYPARAVRGNNREEVIAEIERMFNDGSLDSGFGFQRLTGYSMTLATTYQIITEHGPFTRTEYEEVSKHGLGG